MINYLIEANLWLELRLDLVLLDLQCAVSCLPLDSIILLSVVDIIDIDNMLYHHHQMCTAAPLRLIFS